MKCIFPLVEHVRIVENNKFLAIVNGKEYHGHFNVFGMVAGIDFCKEVNSSRQTTWRIKTVIETTLNNIITKEQ